MLGANHRMQPDARGKWLCDECHVPRDEYSGYDSDDDSISSSDGEGDDEGDDENEVTHPTHCCAPYHTFTMVGGRTAGGLMALALAKKSMAVATHTVRARGYYALFAFSHAASTTLWRRFAVGSHVQSACFGNDSHSTL